MRVVNDKGMFSNNRDTPEMMKKKICLVGAFAVGKTSLVRQYVDNIFSEKYHTTLGVKIDKKSVQVDSQDLDLIIWDLAGEDDFISVKMSYLRGAAGYIIVVDGTRKDTLETALNLIQRVQNEVGKLPYVVLVNKHDLEKDWQIDDKDLKMITKDTNRLFKTSALTGDNVEAAFMSLSRLILGFAE